MSVALTAFYSYRLLFQTFLNRTNAPKEFLLGARDPHGTEAIPLALLAVGSVLIGRMSRDAIIGLGSTF